jgi:pimeloyl-ACP methyl ester carboxylesterase
MSDGARRDGRALERSGYVPSGDGSLYCTVFRPASGDTPGAGVILLSAFAGERKSTVKPLVDLARALAAEGIAAMRVDFRGTGDSSGTSDRITLASMLEDVDAAAAALRSEAGCTEVAFAGLRLGASVALAAGVRVKPSPAALVIAEPVVAGASYIRELGRRQAIRRMLTDGGGTSAGDDGAAALDFDGFALDHGFVAELSRFDLLAAAPQWARGPGARSPSLVLQIGAKRSPRKDLARLSEACGERAALQVVVTEPFWLPVDHVDPTSATAPMKSFLSRTLGAPAARAEGDNA